MRLGLFVSIFFLKKQGLTLQYFHIVMHFKMSATTTKEKLWNIQQRDTTSKIV